MPITRELRPTTPGIARLLSMLVQNYPKSRPLLSALHAMREPISVDLKSENRPTSVLGDYVPNWQAIRVSPFLQEPDAANTLLHEASHAHDVNFGYPTKLPNDLMSWHKTTMPFAIPQMPEALADRRAFDALGTVPDYRRILDTQTRQSADWGLGHPSWPQTQSGPVDESFLKRVLGPAVFEAIRQGTYRTP